MRNINSTQLVYNGIDGIWNIKGCLPNPNESISISLEQSSGYNPDEAESLTGSLLDLVGFSVDQKDIGVIKQKTISELVILLPMIKRAPAESSEPIAASGIINTIDPCNPCEEAQSDEQNAQSSEYYESEKERAFLFKIPESLINGLLNVQDYKTLSIFELRNVIMSKSDTERQNSIMRLMTYMVNYNFPPHLNWLLNQDIPPLCMYGLEFSSNLNTQDLADIWQNDMPKQAKEPEEETSWIEHELNQNEIFSGYDILNGDLDIKMKIFKVKKRANSNYERDYLNYGHNLNNTNQNKWYNYNWPYDYFSLVELVSIEAGEVYGETDQPYSNIAFFSYQPTFQFVQDTDFDNQEGSRETWSSGYRIYSSFVNRS